MKKLFVSAALLGLALRLAVVAGAEETFEEVFGRFSGGKTVEIVEVEPPQENEGEAVETVLVAVRPDTEDEALNIGEAQTPAVEETTIVSQLSIKNDTDISLDAAALLAEDVNLDLSPGQPRILIIHTHGSEAYTKSAAYNYAESDPYRTEDCDYNVIKVGDVLTEKLQSYGLEVIHDRGIYDYPSYTGSYTRSGEAVESYLEQYPGIQIVLDLHRDAIGSGDTVYKTKAELDGQSCAQVMLLVGTGANGLAHPSWQENMKLALRMQQAMDEAYPTLARPLAVKSERYNQHLTTGSLILEVGSTGNTMEEALRAVELFGDAVGSMLAEMARA